MDPPCIEIVCLCMTVYIGACMALYIHNVHSQLGTTVSKRHCENTWGGETFFVINYLFEGVRDKL